MDNIYRYYTLTVNGLSFDSAAPGTGAGQYIADSGTTLLYTSDDVAAAFNAGFQPPAMLNETLGVYIVDCNATIPSLAVTVGGQDFAINSEDLNRDVGVTPGELCISGVIPSGRLPGNLTGILGDVFLNNVLAVFDVGQEEMTFYEREYYES